MTGILLVDKAPGPTSHDVVDAVRRAAGTRRVGHFGTLDPFASGLLVLGIGPATRLAPFCVDHPKTYRAVVRLGWTSDTDDADGELEPTSAEPATRAAVEAACARWTGEVRQVPPAFSAKRVGGERAYARARAGEAVSLPAATVRIDRIAIERYDWPDVELTVECGPGTYVRALARDLGEDLGVGGFCAVLRRTRSGPFDVAAALAWDALREAGPAEVAEVLLPAEAAVVDLPAAELEAAAARLAAHGGAVDAPAGLPSDARWVRLRGPGGFVGLAERAANDGRGVLLPRKVLYPEGEEAWTPGEPG